MKTKLFDNLILDIRKIIIMLIKKEKAEIK
jgi:hypothetical protein